MERATRPIIQLAALAPSSFFSIPFWKRSCSVALSHSKGENLESPKRGGRTVTFGKTWNKINLGRSHSTQAGASQPNPLSLTESDVGVGGCGCSSFSATLTLPYVYGKAGAERKLILASR